MLDKAGLIGYFYIQDGKLTLGTRDRDLFKHYDLNRFFQEKRFFLRLMTESTQKNKKWDSAKEQIFLNILRETGNVSASAAAAGVDRSYAYRKRQNNMRFRDQWHGAMEEALDNLEDDLWGKVRTVDSKVGSEKQLNERIALLLLKAHRPEIFGDGKVRKRHAGNAKTASPRIKLLAKLEKMSGRTKSWHM